MPWHTQAIVPGVVRWVSDVRGLGLRLCLLTHNYGDQARVVAETLSMPLVRGALKPMPAAFRHSLRTLAVSAPQALCIGDQLFTDVLGAKLVGMRAVYVRPIAQRAFITTRLMRLLERPLLARLRRAGVPGA